MEQDGTETPQNLQLVEEYSEVDDFPRLCCGVFSLQLSCSFGLCELVLTHLFLFCVAVVDPYLCMAVTIAKCNANVEARTVVLFSLNPGYDR